VKILVVEDQPRIASSLKQGLEIKSYIVDVAHDGELGLDFALSEKYDVIILDRMLPKLSGMEVCKQLRAEGNKTPILMLTAKVETQDKVDGLEVGADDYLTKPFVFNELVARVNALGRRPPEWKQSTLELGSLVLDPIATKVFRLGKEIMLSKKEFALLAFLMRHPDQVFTAQQLTEQVWNFDSQVTANAAQVYIGYLRKKIDAAFPKEKPLLKTIRGFGYTISADGKSNE
jgi:DNA-binding response OmpR family regulator